MGVGVILSVIDFREDCNRSRMRQNGGYSAPAQVNQARETLGVIDKPSRRLRGPLRRVGTRALGVGHGSPAISQISEEAGVTGILRACPPHLSTTQIVDRSTVQAAVCFRWLH